MDSTSKAFEIMVFLTFLIFISLFLYGKKDNPVSENIIKVSGTIDNISNNGMTVITLKETKTKFYIDPNFQSRKEDLLLTTPGDTVQFTVKSKEPKLTEHESMIAYDFSNNSYLKH